MFVLFATKPLNDGTKGFRFNFAGFKGLVRVRKNVSRFGIAQGDCTKAIHAGKRSVYLESKPNRTKQRKFRHFAG